MSPCVCEKRITIAVFTPVSTTHHGTPREAQSRCPLRLLTILCCMHVLS